MTDQHQHRTHKKKIYLRLCRDLDVSLKAAEDGVVGYQLYTSVNDALWKN